MSNIPIGQRPKKALLTILNNTWEATPVNQQDAVKKGVHRYNLFENYFKDRSKDQSKEFSSNPIVNQLIANTVGSAIRGAGGFLRGYDKASELGSKGSVFLADQLQKATGIDIDRDIVSFSGSFLPEILTGKALLSTPKRLRSVASVTNKSKPKVFLPPDLLEGISPNAKLFTPKKNGIVNGVVNGNGVNGTTNGTLPLFGKGKNKYGLYSKISTMPKTIPTHLQPSAEKFMRAAYTYARKNPGVKDMKGFGRWFDDKGDSYFAKTNHKHGNPFSLKLASVKQYKKYDAKRKSLSHPWRRDETINLIQDLLEKRGKKYLTGDLVQKMENDYFKKVDFIKSQNMSIGHRKALKNGGLDIAENIEAESLKYIDGKKGNAARGARHDLPDEELKKAGVILSWDEYIDKHLPLLEASRN